MLQAQVFRFALPGFLSNTNLTLADMLKLKGIDPDAEEKKPTYKKKKKKKRRTNK